MMSSAGCDPAPAPTGTPEAGSSGSVFVYDELTKGIARRVVAQVYLFLYKSLSHSLALPLALHTHTMQYNTI